MSAPRSSRALAALIAASLLAASPAAVLAQFSWADTLYAGGAFGFTYRQTPIPIYAGEFDAEGSALDLDGSWDPGQTEAVGGGMGLVTPDSVMTAIYGVTDNGDGTFDGALVLLRTQGALQPGSFAVDALGGTALFGFVDDAVGFSLPDTLDLPTVIAWFQDLSAAHKLVSFSGSIHVATVSADTLAGTFSGLAAEADNPFFIVSVSDGHFELAGDPAAAVPPAPAAAIEVVAAPNPFNPATTLRFDLSCAQRVTVAIHDPAGRRLRRLHDAPLAAGPHAVRWDGADQAGRRLAAGVYVARVVGEGWSTAAKVVLCP